MNRRLTTAIAFVCATSALTGVAAATADATGRRLAGDTRFATAQVVATETFTDGAGVAVLASGRNFPDALSSAYLAGVSGSPVLTTEPGELSAGVLETLEELGVQGVFIVGGEAAVSSDVFNAIDAAGYVVDRIAGENRYSTARQAAEIAGSDPIGEFGAGKAALVVSGVSYADALAAGPIAAAQGLPILLTPRDALGPDAESALLGLGIEQAILVGGTAAVSEAVGARINSLGIDVRRVAGATRQETSRLLAELATAELQFPTERVLLARGDGFADALTGGGRGGALAAPIILTVSPTDLGDAARRYLADHADTIALVEALGGTAAVAESVLDQAVTVTRG